MAADYEKLAKVAEILKKRFPNLTTQETIQIAAQILQAIEK